MSPSQGPYCRLQQEVFEDQHYQTLTRVYDSFDELWAGLLAIWEKHAKHDPSVGVSCVLHNRRGGDLRVGISAEGWLLILEYPCGIQVVFSLREPDGSIPFLLPHWTELPRSCLHDQGDARQAIQKWLETGAMDLFLITGRRLGYPFS